MKDLRSWVETRLDAKDPCVAVFEEIISIKLNEFGRCR